MLKMFLKLFSRTIFASSIGFSLGVGHGAQREGKECEEMVRTAKTR
jgi:hypothetical protein